MRVQQPKVLTLWVERGITCVKSELDSLVAHGKRLMRAQQQEVVDAVV